MKILDALAFAVAACRAAAPAGVAVDSAANVDAAERMPLVIVDTTGAQSVANGPNAAAATLRVVASVHAENRAEASRIARDMYAGVVQSWREHRPNRHGEFVHISNGSTLPYQVDSGLEADGIYRFDFIIEAVVRPL